MPRRGGGGGRRSGGGGLFGGGGGLFGKRSSSPSRSRTSVPARRPSSSSALGAPAPSGGMMGGLGSAIAQGMAFGGGSAIAHRAVDAVAGPRELKVSHEGGGAPSEAARGGGEAREATGAPGGSVAVDCARYAAEMNSCLAENTANISSCQPHVDMFAACQRGEMMRE